MTDINEPVQTYSQGDTFRFDCHFGPRECQGNIYHACAAAKIPDTQDLMDYVRCMINDNYDPPRAALRCTREVEVDWEEIKRCATGQEGLTLHKEAGDKTGQLSPRVSAGEFSLTIYLSNWFCLCPEVFQNWEEENKV